MRKRAQMRTPIVESVREQKIVKQEKKPIRIKKNWWIGISLVVIFFLVLILNSYFNIISGVAINPEGETMNDTYYLSGPDPYYNMRLVNVTLETGNYPYYFEDDPILNYPVGRSGARPPLLNMMALGFSRLLLPFMSESDAVGYSMQFVPALFGALIIFPVYFIGKALFGKKEGLIAALLISIIPIHLGSGHGSAYGLFDHDSFNLLIFFLIFLFLIKSITDKDPRRSILYALLSGTAVAALTLTWVESRFIYTIIAGYAIVQMLIDIFTSKTDWRFVRSMLIILFTGYLVSYPVLATRYAEFKPDLSLYLGIGVALFGAIYILLNKKKIPWVISIPAIFSLAGIVLTFLYYLKDLVATFPFLSALNGIRQIIFGIGIYGKKVSLTIAEAGTYNISRSVMSYGPALYWLAWAGLVFLIYRYYKEKGRRDYFFIIVLFLINIWLASTAGRFLNDMVPLVAILAGFMIWFVVAKIDFKQMIRNIRNAGGGFRGIRRGIKAFHILGILFVSFLIILPNAFLALDAAVPSAVTRNGTSNMKIDYFGEDHSGAFGSSSYKEQYWVDALAWLNRQDIDIEDPTQKPAFISWWDYGFYESAVGGHPTVADNFQDGIPTAANFHTAKSEKEAVAVLIIRLMQGDLKDNGGALSQDIVNILQKHLGENNTNAVVNWMENPNTSPSYNAPIGEEYDEELSQTLLVGEQYPENAYIHDITEIMNNTLNDEEITWLYHDVQQATGYSIRYYGVEGYDTSIFNIFAFLGDKSLVLHALRSGGGLQFYNAEDDFIQVKYVGYSVNVDGTRGADGEWSANELNEMPNDERARIVITDTKTVRKSDYFKTMFYRTYIGEIPEQLEEDVLQLPCWNMRHFHAEYISELPYFNSGRSTVVIAKYYEGTKINGTVQFMGEPVQAQTAIRKEVSLYGNQLLTDHDKNDTENGEFSLIAPAGNITLEFRRNTELEINAFVMKSVTFNSTTDPELAPITDDEAMRINGTNYERTVNITIDPANIDGYVYANIDNKTEYNTSIDEPLYNVEVTLYEILQFLEEGANIGRTIDLTTNDTGYYNASGLLPGIYLVRAVLDDFTIHEDYAFVYSGNNSYNVSKPSLSGVEGVVYFDENENDEYDVGEEMSSVDVDLLYRKLDISGEQLEAISVGLIKTDNTGSYSFSSLVPGEYIFNASKINNTTEYLDYAIEETVTLKENKTATFNVSITYAPIVVSGYTKHGNDNIHDISIEFSPNGTVKNNTVQLVRVISDADGYYSADLMPGSYNITVDDSVEQGTYSFTGQLSIKMGEGVKAFDVSLTKQSITVTGNTKYDNTNKGNISILFLPDEDVVNNTAVEAITVSDEDGSYVAELMPGTYNVTVDELVNESGRNVTYSFTGELVIQADEISKSFDIILTREEEP